MNLFVAFYSFEIISEAISINHALVSQPFVSNDIILTSKYNIIEYWKGSVVSLVLLLLGALLVYLRLTQIGGSL